MKLTLWRIERWTGEAAFASRLREMKGLAYAAVGNLLVRPGLSLSKGEPGTIPRQGQAAAASPFNLQPELMYWCMTGEKSLGMPTGPFAVFRVV